MRQAGGALKTALWLVLIVALGSVGLIYALSEVRLARAYEVAVSPPRVVTDPDLVARGRHIAVTRGCTDCHGDDGGGKIFLEAPGVASLYASNLTRGAGGTASYSSADWDRAVRHGVAPDGRPLLGMPSLEYAAFSDEDLAALITYFRLAPPVNRELPEPSVGPVGRVLLLAGKLPPLAAELIDHAAPRADAPPLGATVEYGEYLAKICTGCHGLDYRGSLAPGPPGSPPAPDITGAALSAWSEQDFVRALRHGRRPDGTELRVEFMPWNATTHMTDEELSAMWQYLRSLLPARVED